MSRKENENAVQQGRTAANEQNEFRSENGKLIRGGLGVLSRLNTDEAALAATVLKLHEPRNHGVQRVIAAPPHVFARLMLRAPLPHQNRACVNELPAEALYAQPLPV
jgi:hypothetical protein